MVDESDEPIVLEHDDILTRLRAYRRAVGASVEDLVDLTEAEAALEDRSDRDEVVRLPEAPDQG